MKVGDKLICKKKLYLVYPGYVGDIEYGMLPNKKYEISDITTDSVSVRVDWGFCISFSITENLTPWQPESYMLTDYFHTIKILRRSKLQKLIQICDL